MSFSLLLFYFLSHFLSIPHHQLSLSLLLSRTNKHVPGWGMKSGSRPSASSLSPSPSRVGKMTGRGVGMKFLSGHQVYLTSAIIPLTVRMLRAAYVKDQWYDCKIEARCRNVCAQTHTQIHTHTHRLTEHGHVLQRLETPTAPQCFISMSACVTPQIKGWFSAKWIQDSKATPRTIKKKFILKLILH